MQSNHSWRRLFRKLPFVVLASSVVCIFGYLGIDALYSSIFVDSAGIPLSANTYTTACPRCGSIHNRILSHDTRICNNCGARFRTWLDSNRRQHTEIIP